MFAFKRFDSRAAKFFGPRINHSLTSSLGFELSVALRHPTGRRNVEVINFTDHRRPGFTFGLSSNNSQFQYLCIDDYRRGFY